MKEYEKLQSQYNQATKSHNVTKQELQELREENAELVRQNQNMTTAMNDIATEQQKCKETVTTLNRALADLQLHHDTTVENYLQQLEDHHPAGAAHPRAQREGGGFPHPRTAAAGAPE